MSARLHQTVVRCSADTGSSSDRAPTSTTASAEDLHASVNDLIRNFVQGRSDFEEGGKNAAILSYGARGTGKTRCLFDEEVGVVPTLLEQACSCGSGQFYCTLIAFSADDRVWDLFQTEPALLSSRGYHSDFSQSARRLPLGGPCGPGGHAGHQHANKSAMMDTLKDALRLRIGGAKKGACSSKGSSSSVHLGGHHVVFSLHRKAAIGEGVQAEGNHLADGCAMSPASSVATSETWSSTASTSHRTVHFSVLHVVDLASWQRWSCPPRLNASSHHHPSIRTSSPPRVNRGLSTLREVVEKLSLAKVPRASRRRGNHSRSPECSSLLGLNDSEANLQNSVLNSSAGSARVEDTTGPLNASGEASRFPSALDERSFISSRRYVPYRNSRLTQFLRPVLSGDERLQLRSLWILCVSPRPEDRLDSEETLRFGELLRSIPRVAASRGSTLTGARRSVELFSQTKLKPRLPTGIFPKGPIGSVVERVVAAPVEASGPGAIEEANVAIGCRLKRPRSFSTGQIAIEFNTSEADCNPDGKHGGEEDEEEPGPTTRKRRSLSSSCVEYEMCGYETCGDCGTKDSAALEGIRTMDPTDTSGSLGVDEIAAAVEVDLQVAVSSPPHQQKTKSSGHDMNSSADDSISPLLSTSPESCAFVPLAEREKPKREFLGEKNPSPPGTATTAGSFSSAEKSYQSQTGSSTPADTCCPTLTTPAEGRSYVTPLRGAGPSSLNQEQRDRDHTSTHHTQGQAEAAAAERKANPQAFPEWPLLHRETKTVYYSMAANVKILPRTPLTGVSSCPSTNAKNFCMSSDLEDSVEDDDENGVADVYENGFDVLNARAKQDQAMQATQQRRDKTTGSRLTEMACTSTPPSSSSDESDGFRARLSQLAAEIEKIDVRRDLEGGADANGGEESKKSERLRMPETSSGLEEASMPNIDKDEGEEEDGQIRYPEYFAIGTPRGHRGIATERAYDGKGRFGDAEFGCGGPVFSPETKPPVDAFRTPAYRRSVPDSAATLSYGYLDEDTSFDHPDHSPHRQSKVPLEDFWAKTNPSDCSLSPACPAEDVQGQEEQFHICPTDDHRFAPMHVRRQELALLEEAERAANTDDDTLFEPLYHADVDSYSFMQSDSQLMFPTDFTGLLARGAAEGVEVASNGRQEFFSPRSVKIPAKTNFRGDLLVVSNREEDGAFWKHHLQTVGGDPGVVGSRARFRGDLAVSQDKSDTLWERHFRTLPGPRVDGVEEQGMTKVSYPEESLLYRSSPSEYPVSSGDDFCHCSPGIQKTSTGSSIPVAGRWTTRGGSGGSKKSRASPYSKATSGAVAASVPMPPRTPVADVFVKHAHQTVSSYHDFAPSCSSGASTRAPDSGDSHHLVTRQKAEKRDGSCASPLSDLGGCGKFVLDESPLMELSAAGGEGDPVSDHGGAEAAAWLSPTPKAGNAATSSFALLGDISPLSLPNDSTPEKFDHSTPEKVDSLVRPGGGSVGGGSDEVVKRSLSPLLGEVEEAAEGVLLTAPDDKERQEHEQDAKVAAREVHYVPLFSLETALTEVSPVLLNFERPRKMKQEHPLSPILEDDLSACSEDEEQGEKQVGDFIERENACDHAAILEESRCTVSMPGSPGQRTDDGVDLDSASDWCKTPTEKNRNKISPRRVLPRAPKKQFLEPKTWSDEEDWAKSPAAAATTQQDLQKNFELDCKKVADNLYSHVLEDVVNSADCSPNPNTSNHVAGAAHSNLPRSLTSPTTPASSGVNYADDPDSENGNSSFFRTVFDSLMKTAENLAEVTVGGSTSTSTPSSGGVLTSTPHRNYRGQTVLLQNTARIEKCGKCNKFFQYDVLLPNGRTPIRCTICGEACDSPGPPSGTGSDLRSSDRLRLPSFADLLPKQ
mmetsp:Transcript_18015/g.45038  ORF Transcript_18015/g.45038 Transcript_18015/m.45038 type:complete len:1872 (-) Transcript_18015:880-6495(-)